MEKPPASVTTPGASSPLRDLRGIGTGAAAAGGNTGPTYKMARRVRRRSGRPGQEREETSAAGRACHHGPCRSRRVDCPAGCRIDSGAVNPSPCPPPRRAFSMTGKLLLGWLALFAAVLVLIHICPAGGQDANPGTAQLGRLPLPPAPVVPPAPSAVPEV